MQNLSYLHRFGAGQYFMEIFLAPASCVVRPRNLSEPISLAIQLAGLRLSLANLTQAHHHSAVGLNPSLNMSKFGPEGKREKVNYTDYGHPMKA